MRILPFICLLLIFNTSSFAGPDKNTFVLPDLGISMQVPAPGEINTYNYQIAMFFLPSTDQFAANINIMRQNYAESIESFDQLSLNQFRSRNYTILKHQIKGREIIYEYKGKMQNRTLHWYTRALKGPKCFYLVTATALDSCWPKQKTKLIEAVDSFLIE